MRLSPISAPLMALTGHGLCRVSSGDSRLSTVFKSMKSIRAESVNNWSEFSIWTRIVIDGRAMGLSLLTASSFQDAHFPFICEMRSAYCKTLFDYLCNSNIILKPVAFLALLMQLVLMSIGSEFLGKV